MVDSLTMLLALKVDCKEKTNRSQLFQGMSFLYVESFSLSESYFTAQKMKFSIKDLLNKCDRIPSFL